MVVKKIAAAGPKKIIPAVIENPRLADFLEVMSVAVFQAGMSWASVLNNLEAYRVAYKGFEPKLVGKFNTASIRRLLITPDILHSEKKILAVIKNARTLLATEKDFGGFQKYLQDFDSYEALEADLHERFEFMGRLNVYYFLFRTGQKVPPFEKWIKTIDGEHPRMAEMIRAGKKGKTNTAIKAKK